MRHRIVMITTLCALAITPSASAALTQAQVGALQAQVASLTPAAKSEVQQATAAGPAALKALELHVLAMPMPAPDQTTPEQYALMTALIPDVQLTYSGTAASPTSLAPSASPLSPSSNASPLSTSCWFQGSNISWSGEYSMGVIVGSFGIAHGYWCGNGSSITSNGLGYWLLGPSATPPYCIVDVGPTTWGWDAPNNAWAHGVHTTHFGGYTPWLSCSTFEGGSAAIRVAANGYHDHYNDF